MRTPSPSAQLADLPVAALATAAPADRLQDMLLALGTHRSREGAWVVAGPRAVQTALTTAGLSVAPPAGERPGSSAAQLVGRMARFSDPPAHQQRRDLVIRLLPSAAEASRIAGALAGDYLRRRTASFDIMPMARALPVTALARALGLSASHASRAATLTAALCDALSPSLLPQTGTGSAGDGAAAELAGLLAGLGEQDEEQIAALISILFQARDATAALIGTAVLAGGRPEPADPAPVAQRVDGVLRTQAPVQCTRRLATADVRVGDAIIPAGAQVWIFVATAEEGGGVPATFGGGPHGCPGAAQATAIARQLVTALDAEGWRPVPGQHVILEPRPNIRIPGRVMVARP